MNEITEISTKVNNKPRTLKKYNHLLENKIIAMVPVRA